MIFQEISLQFFLLSRLKNFCHLELTELWPVHLVTVSYCWDR